MKRYSYLPIVLILLLFTACPKIDTENCHYSITVINDSDFDIYHDIYLDTLGIYQSPKGLIGNAYWLKVPAKGNNRYVSQDCYEYFFTKGTSFYNGTYGLLDSLRVYIFDALEVEQNLKKEMLKRYDLTLEDLRKLDWTVAYPPTEAMKDIIQYPPYIDSD